MMLKKILIKCHRFLLVIGGLLLVLLSPLMPLETLVLAIGAVFGVALYQRPKVSIMITLVLLPYLNTTILTIQLISMIPLKLFVIMFIALFGVMFIKYKVNVKSKIDHKALALFVIYVLVFAISVFRSIGYIDAMGRAWQDNFSTVRLVNNFLITPVIYLVPSLIVFLYFNYEDYKKIINAFTFSLFFLSTVLLLLYLFVIPSRTDFSTIRVQLGAYIGLHGNGIADFYIITFPLLFVVFMNETRMIIKITFYLSIFAIAILFSRTAYICVVFTFLLYSIYRKKIDQRFIGLLSVLSVILIFLPQSVYDRFLSIGAGSNLNSVTAGRTGDIWLPIWLEWIQSSNIIKLFGTGRYSIVQSFVFRNGVILDVTHPHNMYLEALLDIGIVGLLLYLMIFAVFVLQAYKVFLNKNIKQYDKDILFAIIISFLLFLISGLSGRTLFPTITNSYIWVMLMTSVVICRHYNEDEPRWLREE